MEIKILDTNIILEHSLQEIVDNAEVETKFIIPFKVLMELDTFKKGTETINFHARRSLGFLETIRKCELEDLTQGAKYGSSIIQVYFSEDDLDIDPCKVDNSIILTAKAINETEDNVELLSEDLHERLIADAFGIKSNGFHLNITDEDLYTGKTRFQITDKQIDEFYSVGYFETKRSILENQFTIMEDSVGGIHYGIYRQGKVYKLNDHYNAWGIKPKKDKTGKIVTEQAMFMHLLMDPEVQFITAAGPSGCGKTLLTLACALEQTLKTNKYDKVVVMRPLVTLDRDIGALPGNKLEKIEPWMASTFDNLEYLFERHTHDDSFVLSGRDKIYELMEYGKIELEAMQFIRGRSIPNQFIIVDDCFVGETKIATENGQRTIQSLTNSYNRGESLPMVCSFNEKTKQFEYKNILNAVSKGKKKVVEARFGKRKIRCTPDHRFLTVNGWKKLNTINDGDFVIMSEPNKQQVLKAWTEDQKSILLGSYLGDGSITNHGKNRYRLRVSHSPAQKDYLMWKAKMLDAQTWQSENNGHGEELYNLNTKIFPDASKYLNNKTSCSQELLDLLDPISLAVWYMDDGSCSGTMASLWTSSFDEETQQRIVNTMYKKFDLICKAQWNNHKGAKSEGYWKIVFDVKETKKLFNIIRPYIHKDLYYKVDRGPLAEEIYDWDYSQLQYGLCILDEIVNIDNEVEVFDIEVEDNHNFVIRTGAKRDSKGNKNTSGIVVHNCQNLTPHQATTIITRAGEGSKVVFLGDVNKQQIDNHRLNSYNNGLAYVIERFKGSDPIIGHITMETVVRSKLASLGVRLL